MTKQYEKLSYILIIVNMSKPICVWSQNDLKSCKTDLGKE